MTHRSGIIVLISGDIDFAETVHDLVHTGGYTVVLIHNKQARPELCKNSSKALLFRGHSEAGPSKGSMSGKQDAKNDKASTDRKNGKKEEKKGPEKV